MPIVERSDFRAQLTGPCIADVAHVKLKTQVRMGDQIICFDCDARFASVVLPHLDEAYRLAHLLTGNRVDAEDVVQDACVRALRGICNFCNGNSRAWVLTIVRHTAYSWLRKNRSGILVNVEDLETVERAQAKPREPDIETPETALIAKMDTNRLQTAIAALPAAYREMLVLRDVHGLAYREIAEVAEVPIGTVMSRLARARLRLIATRDEASRRGKAATI
jgi:RNA polymerase sigma factor (sigma-70 family)